MDKIRARFLVFKTILKKNLPKNADVTNQVFGRRVCLKILNQNIMFKYRTNFHVSVTKWSIVVVRPLIKNKIIFLYRRLSARELGQVHYKCASDGLPFVVLVNATTASYWIFSNQPLIESLFTFEGFRIHILEILQHFSTGPIRRN